MQTRPNNITNPIPTKKILTAMPQTFSPIKSISKGNNNDNEQFSKMGKNRNAIEEKTQSQCMMCNNLADCVNLSNNHHTVLSVSDITRLPSWNIRTILTSICSRCLVYIGALNESSVKLRQRCENALQNQTLPPAPLTPDSSSNEGDSPSVTTPLTIVPPSPPQIQPISSPTLRPSTPDNDVQNSMLEIYHERPLSPLNTESGGPKTKGSYQFVKTVPIQLVCKYCNRTYKLKHFYNKHLRSCSMFHRYAPKPQIITIENPATKPNTLKPRKFHCNLCPDTMDSIHKLYQHKRTHYQRFPCDICAQECTTLSDYEFHRAECTSQLEARSELNAPQQMPARRKTRLYTTICSSPPSKLESIPETTAMSPQETVQETTVVPPEEPTNKKKIVPKRKEAKHIKEQNTENELKNPNKNKISKLKESESVRQLNDQVATKKSKNKSEDKRPAKKKKKATGQHSEEQIQELKAVKAAKECIAIDVMQHQESSNKYKKKRQNKIKATVEEYTPNTDTTEQTPDRGQLQKLNNAEAVNECYDDNITQSYDDAESTITTYVQRNADYYTTPVENQHYDRPKQNTKSINRHHNKSLKDKIYDDSQSTITNFVQRHQELYTELSTDGSSCTNESYLYTVIGEEDDNYCFSPADSSRLTFTNRWVLEHSNFTSPRSKRNTSTNYYNLHLKSKKEEDLYLLERLKKEIKLGSLTCFESHCSFTAFSLNDIMLHDYIDHFKKPRFYCRKCRYYFTSKVFLDYHMDVQDNGRYICHKCARVFSYQRQLDHHLYLHALLGKKFKCKYCRLEYLDKEQLVRHRRQDKHNWRHVKRRVRIDHSRVIKNKTPRKRRRTIAEITRSTVKILNLKTEPMTSKRCTPLEQYLPNLKPYLREALTPYRIGRVEFDNTVQPNCVGGA